MEIVNDWMCVFVVCWSRSNRSQTRYWVMGSRKIFIIWWNKLRRIFYTLWRSVYVCGVWCAAYSMRRRCVEWRQPDTVTSVASTTTASSTKGSREEFGAIVSLYMQTHRLYRQQWLLYPTTTIHGHMTSDMIESTSNRSHWCHSSQ